MSLINELEKAGFTDKVLLVCASSIVTASMILSVLLTLDLI